MNTVTELALLHEQAGFKRVIRRKGSGSHPIWRCPCGHRQIVDTSSRCGGRGPANAKARIARTLRECKQRLEEKDAA